MRRKPDRTRTEQVLSITQEAGGISRLTMKLMGICPSKQTMWLNRLVEQELISKRDTDSGAAYSITAQGSKYLEEINARRHVRHVATGGLSADMVGRNARISEVVAILKLAGYSTHQDDKPTLYNAIMQVRKKQNAGETDPAILLSPNNMEQYTYLFYGCFDSKAYIRRKSAMNCFYYSTEVKDYISGQMKEQFSVYMEKPAISFSRIIGILVTPSGPYRLYNTGKAAMQVRMAGENAMRISLADVVCGLTGSSELSVDDVIILGDSYRGAHKLVAASQRAGLSRGGYKAVAAGNNAAAMKIREIGRRVLYIPLDPASAPLLRLLQYPEWRSYIRQMALGSDAGPVGEIFDGELDDIPVYLEFILDLKRLENLIHYLLYVEVPAILIACLDWQQGFYQDVLNAVDGLACDVRFFCFQQEDLFLAIQSLHNYYIKSAGGLNEGG